VKDVHDAQAAVLSRLRVPDEVQRKIFGGNFDRLFAR
jgi:hypothetical protein